VPGQYLAEATHEMSIRRERPSKCLFEFVNEVVKSLDYARELVDSLTHYRTIR
jgi:hypothetical protein